MKKNEYNAIGIDQQLDWQRIRKLLFIGLFFATFHLVADLLLDCGWIAIGNLWMFGGLLALSRKVEE